MTEVGSTGLKFITVSYLCPWALNLGIESKQLSHLTTKAPEFPFLQQCGSLAESTQQLDKLVTFHLTVLTEGWL